jgi:sirohydrochlorin cobaltochelatase
MKEAVMDDVGIVMIYHGDVPLDYREEEKETYEGVQTMMAMASEKIRAISRDSMDDPHCNITKEVARKMKEKGGYEHVEVGFMNFCRPTVEEAVEKLKSEGVDTIIALTNFNLQGESAHSLLDAPEIVRELQEKYPDVEFEYLNPGFAQEEVAQILIEKINENLKGWTDGQ